MTTWPDNGADYPLPRQDEDAAPAEEHDSPAALHSEHDDDRPDCND